MSEPFEPPPEPLQMAPSGPHGPLFSDFDDVIQTTYWLFVLASRPLYATLTRALMPEHLAELLDIFIAYAARGSRYYDEDFEPVPWEQREPLARKLRGLIVAWTPPELPEAITAAARALLHAEGHEAPEGGWDRFVWDGPEAVEDALLWPEGVPLILRRQADEEAARSAADPSAPPMTVEELLGPKPERRNGAGRLEILAIVEWNHVALMNVKVTPAADGTLPYGAEFGEVSQYIPWLMVLASPPLYRTLGRTPDRGDLVRLTETFITYAARGRHITAAKKARRRALGRREALARKLRVLMETWTPPELPPAITDAARELLEAEGLRSPEGGWDNLKHDKPGALEDVLPWPEGMPRALQDLTS